MRVYLLKTPNARERPESFDWPPQCPLLAGAHVMNTSRLPTLILRSQPAARLEIFRQRVRTEDAHVVGALERRRVGHIALTHAAAHLANGFVLVFFHPAQETAQDDIEMLDAVVQQCRGHHRNARARHHRLQHILRAMIATQCSRSSNSSGLLSVRLGTTSSSSRSKSG